MSKASLRDALNSGQFIAAPGVHDMITAVVANKIGFDFVYGSGYWTTASTLGLPDAGIATYTQMLDRMSTLARTVNASVIADADTGYGGLLNVHHTVRGYEEAGIVGIQIEDQEFPKKCGHTPFKRVVPLIDMVEKVKVACEARRNPKETVIIARTDARQTDGFEGAMKRAKAYGEAGADVVFLEALESEEEMRIACSQQTKPMMANMADGGKTPIRTKAELAAIGYKLAIFPSMTGLAAAAAAENALRVFKAGGHFRFAAKISVVQFRRNSTPLIGFEEVWASSSDAGRGPTRSRPNELMKVACIGAGTVGHAWAVVFARAGHSVALYDHVEGEVEARALPKARETLGILASGGMLHEPVEAIAARITGASSIAVALSPAPAMSKRAVPAGGQP